ncbi:MAG: hypothetical protein AB7N91_21335 [Candidatus Tectimicrobiota bacterium]
MPELASIQVTADELARRLQQVHNGDSLDMVAQHLGGAPYQDEEHAGGRRLWWRFFLVDRPESMGRYEIYRGDFEHDCLTFGAIVPQGATAQE